MQYELSIQKLVNAPKEVEKIFMQITIHHITFLTAQQPLHQNIVYFLQNNIIPAEDQNYDTHLIKFEVINGLNVIGSIMIFVKEIMGQKQKNVIIKGIDNNHNMTLICSLNINALEGQLPENIKFRRISTKKYDEAHSPYDNQSGKLQILKMGSLMYTFAQRLDPVRLLFKQTMQIILWKNQIKTLLFGLFISLIILNLKISLFSGGLICLLSRKWLLKKYQILIQRIQHEKQLIPKQNMIFLQQHMRKYCDAYQTITQTIINEDKTLIIAIIDRLCLLGLMISICLIFFQFQVIVVIGLWIGLILTSPFGNNFLKSFNPILRYINQLISTLLSEIVIKTQMLIKQQNKYKGQIIKQFYLYQYQRWWVGFDWVQSQKSKWSDQNWNVQLYPRNQPPLGWEWIDNWRIIVNQNTDQNGFVYANDFNKQFKSQKTLKTLRRRMWKRKCVFKKV